MVKAERSLMLTRYKAEPSPITAMGDFIPQSLLFSRLKETSVTENQWNLRGKKHQLEVSGHFQREPEG
jgi:hypothetical protein